MNNTSNEGSNSVAGWVSGPNDRGTLDIIWSSLLTIVLCTWTAVCLNLPHPNDGHVAILLRRAKWMFWAVVGPELVLTVAIGQYASARRSVQRFRSLGISNEGWTLRHGFFADMGGMLLQPKDSSPFVVNSRQLAYLVEKKYVDCPQITATEIWDRSKTDTLARLLTLSQASWFTIQLLGRAALKLPTTTLELSAGAIVFCTIGTFLCWMHKPSDVQTGIQITTEVTMEQILLDAGERASVPYKHTPLDFVAKQSPTCGYDLMNFFGIRLDNRERPLRCFPNDRFPDICTIEKFLLFFTTSAFSSIHLIGWNFTFPSRTEQILWRISSSLIAGATVCFWVFETIAARQRFGRWDKYLIWLHLKSKPAKSILEAEPSISRQDSIGRLDAFEQEQKQAKPIGMWEVGVIIPFVCMYAAARIYMLVEVFVSLRVLPSGVYESFDLVDVLPHW